MNLEKRLEKLETVIETETGETHQERLERLNREMWQGIWNAENTMVKSLRPDHQLLVLRELNAYYESKGYDMDRKEYHILAFHIHTTAYNSSMGKPVNLNMPPALAELWIQHNEDCTRWFHRYDREICVDCFAEHPYKREIEWSYQNTGAAKRYVERCVLCGGELVDEFLFQERAA